MASVDQCTCMANWCQTPAFQSPVQTSTEPRFAPFDSMPNLTVVPPAPPVLGSSHRSIQFREVTFVSQKAISVRVLESSGRK